MELPATLYVRAHEDAYHATALTIGPWSAQARHGGPPVALLTRAVERAGGIEGGQMVRRARPGPGRCARWSRVRR